jgi:TFIIF-interacting CTD phosphatase-like protein
MEKSERIEALTRNPIIEASKTKKKKKLKLPAFDSVRNDVCRPGKKRQRKQRYQQQILSPYEYLLVLARNTIFTCSVKVPDQPSVDDTLSPLLPEQIDVNTVSAISETYSTSIKPEVTLLYIQPLLILDLNGILCHRIRAKRTDADFAKSTYRKASDPVAGTPIVPRTDLAEFLAFLDQYFCLAVWTSAKAKTANKLVLQLFPPAIADRLLFVWAQHHCEKLSSSSMDSECVYEKDLSRVWREYPLWNASNTLLMDDSPYKCQRWHENAVHPPALHGLTSANVNDLISDEANEKKQRLFYNELVDHWKSAPLKQTWTVETGEGAFVQNEKALFYFLHQHAAQHMGWK